VVPFVLRRLATLVPLCFGMVVVGFAIVHLAPGDPVQILVGDYPAPPEYVRQVRERFGLDQPVHVQFARYLREVARGNLGHSFFYGEPVLDVLLSRLPATLALMASALALASAGGVLLGVASARRAGSIRDRALTVVALAGYSLPVFWLGQMLLVWLALRLNWFPVQGMRSIGARLSAPAQALDVLHHLVLPALTLGTRALALNTRLVRVSLGQVLGTDYLRTATAKGLSDRAVVWKHGLRNALLPVVTVMGVNFGHLVAGAVLTETVFAWPGVGRMVYDAVLHRDYPVMLGGLFVISVGVVIGNLMADVTCAAVDPRIRLTAGRS
jgi:peptide/nickel transport system permease protein